MAAGLGRLAGGVLVAGAILWRAGAASALPVSPYFAGHHEIGATSQVGDWTVYDAALEPIFGFGSISIDVDHGMVDDGGVLVQPVTPGSWSFDYNIWGPLVSNLSIQSGGGTVTWGFPAAGVFAVSWVNVLDADDPSVRNTFQVLFVGTSGYHTNTGIAIAPGSVIFSYSPTLSLTASSPAAIGILNAGNLSTLSAFGIGDANGVVTSADLAALQASGDPFLFNRGQYGLEAPVAFGSIAEPLPEPALAWLLAASLAGLVGAARFRE